MVLAILAVLVAGAVTFAHWPVLQARALCFDDEMYLTSNYLVQHPSWTSAGRFLAEVLAPSTVLGYYQPLAMISLMLDYATARQTDNLMPFHRTSLILHLASTFLVMGLLYGLFGRPWIAAAVGLLFGIHPMTVEPIAWVGERKTMLAAVFALPSLLVYIRYARRGGWKPYLAGLVLYVLALMSKPTSIPLPLILLLLDFWPLNRLSKRAVVEKIPFLVVGCVFALIIIISQGRTVGVGMPSGHSAWRIPLIICHDIVFYPCKMVWPANLTSHYPVPTPLSFSNPVILAGVIGTCVLIAGLILSLRWTRALMTGWLMFTVALLPTMGVIGFTTVLTSDKYAYLPAVGFLIVLAWLFDRMAGRPTTGPLGWRHAALGAGVLAAAGLLAIGTRQCLREWQTSERHSFYMFRLAPNSPYVLSNCGSVLDAKGRYEQAIKLYDRAIELAPGYVYAYYNRGNTYYNLRQYDRAIWDYAKAIELKPDFAGAYYNRGNTYYSLRQFDRAIRDCTKAIELRPDFAQAYTNRGNAYNDLGDFGRAIQDYAKAIESEPDFGEAYYNRGNVYNGMGDFGQAVRDYTKAIELRPDFAQAYNNRAIAHFHLKEYDRAWADIGQYRQLGGKPNPGLIKALIAATGRSE